MEAGELQISALEVGRGDDEPLLHLAPRGNLRCSIGRDRRASGELEGNQMHRHKELSAKLPSWAYRSGALAARMEAEVPWKKKGEGEMVIALILVGAALAIFMGLPAHGCPLAPSIPGSPSRLFMESLCISGWWRLSVFGWSWRLRVFVAGQLPNQ